MPADPSDYQIVPSTVSVYEPSKFLAADALDLIIRVVLLLPYTLFKNLAEPLIFALFENLGQPLYQSYLSRMNPLLRPLINGALFILSLWFKLTSEVITRISFKERHQMAGADNHYHIPSNPSIFKDPNITVFEIVDILGKDLEHFRKLRI
jgi:hypothetical protein